MTYVIQKKTKCDECNSGMQSTYLPSKCTTCKGSGYIYEEVDFAVALQEVLTVGAKTSKRNAFYIDTPNTGV